MNIFYGLSHIPIFPIRCKPYPGAKAGYQFNSMALKKIKYGMLWLLPGVVFSMQLIAAPANRDSLLQALEKSPENGETRALILQQLSESYREDIPDESIFFGEELLRIARRLGSPQLLWQGHMSTGVAYAVKGDAPERALQHFMDALDIAKNQKGGEWALRQVKSRINIAGVHWQLENIPTALDYAYENIRQLDALEEPLTLADAYRTAALMHRAAERYDSTLLYLNKALAIYEEQGDELRKAFTLNTLGNTYQKSGQYEKALQILYLARENALLLQDSTLLRDTYSGLANAHLKLRQPGRAEVYARALLAEAGRRGLQPEKAEGLRLLSEICEATNQPDSALFYYRQFATLREQLTGEEKTRLIQEMDTRYRTQEKARENRLLREQYARINFRNTLLLAGSALLLALIVILGFFYHGLRRRKEELERLNEEIIRINSQLVGLMNEKKHMVSLIAHDIRNPLSLIQLNTHELAGSEAFSEEEKKQLIAEIEQATDAIDRASLKIMDIENKAEDNVPIQKITFDLVPVLRESVREFSSYARSKSIALRFNTAYPRGLAAGDPFLARHIIANLLSNAIKYSPQHKKIEVSFRKQDDEVSFTVKDEGPGLSVQEQEQLFQKGKAFASGLAAGERSLGQGLYLTRRYVEAMNGKISVESRPGQGAAFTVRFPDKA